VLELIAAAKGITNPQILDLGTGSGCIAVAAAANIAAARIVAVDISPQALAIARENAARHGVAERITFLEGDLFAPLAAEMQFDAIVSNPPYVADAEMATLPADVRLHEPAGALRAGKEGLDVICRIISEASGRLKPGGTLLLEISPEQSAAARALIAETGGFDSLRAVKDSSGNDRVILARRVPPAAS
jgi:release factor glutamine methyltransferase